jgi:hypothetical protein
MFPYALLFVIKVEIYLYRLLCKVTALVESGIVVSFSIFCGFLPLKCPRFAWIGEFSEAATNNRPTWPLVVALPPAAPRRLRD